MKTNHDNSVSRIGLARLLASSAMFLFCFNLSYAQMTVVNGTNVKVSTGSALNSSENLVLNTGGTLDVQGTLILKKNLVNQNAGASSLGTGSVVFSGTTTQTISGQNVIQNLELANTAGLTVAGNTRVNGILTLTNGLVSLGTYNLLLGPTATVAGSPSAAKMIVPTGTGELQKEFPTAGGSFTYPVGDADGTAEYSPVTLAFNSGTFGTNNYAGVSLVDGQYSGAAISYLTRYWNVTQSGITGFSCNSTFKYADADVTGTESDIFCFKVDPVLPWTAYNAANTANNEIFAHGLSAFGTFTGNLGNATTPPAIRSLQDKTIIAGPQDCADATQTLLIAGNGTTYIVQNGGYVKHYAGTSIHYYAGTKVESGGYMLGKISATFCSPYVHPASEIPVISGIDNPGIGNPNNSFFKIYPNPTPGKFTLELKGDVTAGKVHVEILGVLGERILSKDMQIDRKQEFSLAEKPVGVYIVHVTSGLNSETEKIIKR
jgi:hypothetical protein